MPFLFLFKTSPLKKLSPISITTSQHLYWKDFLSVVFLLSLSWSKRSLLKDFSPNRGQKTSVPSLYSLSFTRKSNTASLSLLPAFILNLASTLPSFASIAILHLLRHQSSFFN